MKKRNIFIAVLSILLLSFCIYRYNLVNKNVARKYVIDKYALGENIRLDSIEMTVESFKRLEKTGDAKVPANMLSFQVGLSIKNIGDKAFNCTIIQESILNIGLLREADGRHRRRLDKIEEFTAW